MESKWTGRIKEAVWWWKRAEKRKLNLKAELVKRAWLTTPCTRSDALFAAVLRSWTRWSGAAASQQPWSTPSWGVWWSHPSLRQGRSSKSRPSCLVQEMRSEMMQEQQSTATISATSIVSYLNDFNFWGFFLLVVVGFLFQSGHRAAAAQRLQTGARGLWQSVQVSQRAAGDPSVCLAAAGAEGHLCGWQTQVSLRRWFRLVGKHTEKKHGLKMADCYFCWPQTQWIHCIFTEENSLKKG